MLLRLMIVPAMLCAIHAPAAANSAATPIDRLQDPAWHSRFVAKQSELHSKTVRMILLGDSILNSFEWGDASEWHRWYGDRDGVDLGFSGDQTGNLLWRLRNGELDGISPRLVVILIGTNNVTVSGWSADDVASAIGSVVDEVRTRLPKTKILLLGLLPSGRPAPVIRTAREVNARLAARYGSGGNNVTYKDLTCLFIKNGELDATLFRETREGKPALHPTPQGLDLLAEAIEPVVSETLGDRPRWVNGTLRDGRSDGSSHDGCRADKRARSEIVVPGGHGPDARVAGAGLRRVLREGTSEHRHSDFAG